MYVKLTSKRTTRWYILKLISVQLILRSYSVRDFKMILKQCSSDLLQCNTKLWVVKKLASLCVAHTVMPVLRRGQTTLWPLYIPRMRTAVTLPFFLLVDYKISLSAYCASSDYHWFGVLIAWFNKCDKFFFPSHPLLRLSRFTSELDMFNKTR